MSPGTREIIRLALVNDATVSEEARGRLFDLIDGKMNQEGGGVGPLLLTMRDAAARLGVSRVTFWRLVKDGVFKPVEITEGVFRYRRLDVECFATQQSLYRPVRRG